MTCPIGPNGYTPAEDSSMAAYLHRMNQCECPPVAPRTAEEAGACGDELFYPGEEMDG